MKEGLLYILALATMITFGCRRATQQVLTVEWPSAVTLNEDSGMYGLIRDLPSIAAPQHVFIPKGSKVDTVSNGEIEITAPNDYVYVGALENEEVRVA